MIRLAVAGATGRMGRCILEMASSDERFEIAAALTEPRGFSPREFAQAKACGSVDLDVPYASKLETPCDVLIDFTVAAGTMAWLEVCTEKRIPMVTGVTGHTDEQLARIQAAADRIAILKAANFSVGINVILKIVGRLAKELGESYDVELVEAHHRGKVDAPSGTALAIVDEILAGGQGSSLPVPTGQERSGNVTFGRRGQVGQRPTGQIGIHSVRMGEVVGRHEVHFSGPGETVTIRHEAHSRSAFAAGALRAAAWIVGKQPGYYTMGDAID